MGGMLNTQKPLPRQSTTWNGGKLEKYTDDDWRNGIETVRTLRMTATL